jgi:hypothetical protein
MSVTTSTTWICNFVIDLVTPDMLRVITRETYIFFAFFCLLAAAFTYFFVPETKAKSLENVDEVSGDTAAHEEKERLYHIAAGLETGRKGDYGDLENVWVAAEKGDKGLATQEDEEVK